MKPGIQTLTTIETSFAAARKLNGGKDRIDGHNYQLRVTVAGNGPETLDVLEAGIRERVLSELDHIMLDERLPRTDPGSVAEWIWSRLEPGIGGLYEIRLQEKRGQWVTVSRLKDG